MIETAQELIAYLYRDSSDEVKAERLLRELLFARYTGRGTLYTDTPEVLAFVNGMLVACLKRMGREKFDEARKEAEVTIFVAMTIPGISRETPMPEPVDEMTTMIDRWLPQHGYRPPMPLDQFIALCN